MYNRVAKQEATLVPKVKVTFGMKLSVKSSVQIINAALENILFFDKKSKAQECVHKDFEVAIHYNPQGAFWQETSNHQA